jgi:hypothetical protein
MGSGTAMGTGARTRTVKQTDLFDRPEPDPRPDWDAFVIEFNRLMDAIRYGAAAYRIRGGPYVCNACNEPGEPEFHDGKDWCRFCGVAQ